LFYETVCTRRRQNRGRYHNPRIEALTDPIHSNPTRKKRKVLCSEVQKIVAEDLPHVAMWFIDVVSVHCRELGELQRSPTGDYDFLTARHPTLQTTKQ
jgi:ABC-type transport system substrate-binding protein